MAYVKLDTGILNSTLWVERECREVFITALLMAMPHEFKEPQEQIAVRSLEPTGFCAPPGWYGFVEAAGIGIIRRAMVDTETGLTALEKLGSEDPESRSAEFAGRRLIRVNGGYLVLNFVKYRDKDHTAAERARRYRDKKAASVSSHRDVITSRRDITQAEAEAEAEARNTEPTALVAMASPKRPAPCPTDEILNLYHAKLPALPRVEVLTETRKKALASRWREVLADHDGDRAQAVEWFGWYFGRVAESKFLTGRTGMAGKNWRAGFDWLINPSNFAKVVEGNYSREAA